MFAIVENGGKQYYLKEGDVFFSEKMDCVVGDEVYLSNVLLSYNHENDSKIFDTGAQAAKVLVEVLEHKKDKKVIIFKKRRRQNSRRKNGHRQQISVVRVKSIA